MGRSPLAVATLLLLPLAFAGASACATPCGRIYPLILMQTEEGVALWNVTRDAAITIPAMLTYRFDMVNEGYTAAQPNQPISIRFEYPRKPDWAEITVAPEVIDVDVNDPRNVQPDTSDPTNPQAQYVFSAPIEITVSLLGQPVLKDGYDHQKLLVFAKSTESGLYQAGYGIKEIRIIPEGALHESDVAGSRDVFTAVALPQLTLAGGEAVFAGTSVTLTTPSAATWWQPASFSMDVDPAPAGRMVFAVHDEAGALVASTPPLDSSAGRATMNVTIARPGQHTATLTLLPEPGALTAPMTFAVPFGTGPLDAEGFRYPKAYLVSVSEALPAPLGSEADALAQFERDVPFFAFESAQAIAASVTLTTPGAPDLGRGLANLQFSLYDPTGIVLSAGSVDPTKPTWGLRVGSLPADGWYVLRITGVGVPRTSAYDARVEVTYRAEEVARNRADGLPDLAGPILGVGGVNLTLPLDALAVWSPSDVTPQVQGASARRYQVTVIDANGTLAYASGLREGAASFSAPAPGRYRAFVFAEPPARAVPFSPVVRAFTFDVGAGNTTVASTFRIDDAFEAPFAATDTLLGFHAVRVFDGAAPPVLEGGELIDADAQPAEARAGGTYFLRVVGRGPPPAGGPLAATLELSYASPVTLVGPEAGGAVPGGLSIPSIAVVVALIAAGSTALAIAVLRRR